MKNVMIRLEPVGRYKCPRVQADMSKLMATRLNQGGRRGSSALQKN